MKNYVLGFSLVGLGLYALQLLPNIIWMVAPPANNVLTKNSSPYPLMNIVEGTFGILTVAVLILILRKGGQRGNGLFLGLAGLFLLGYYVAWFFYYRGVVAPWLLIGGIAAIPPLYFFFAGLWMKNYVALIPCVIFAAAHIFITCSTYL